MSVCSTGENLLSDKVHNCLDKPLPLRHNTPQYSTHNSYRPDTYFYRRLGNLVIKNIKFWI